MTSLQESPDQELERYLLGGMSDEESAQLEERYFSDDGLFERLLAIDAELIDRYVRGDLEGNARKRFEERLASPVRQRRVGYSRLLQDRTRGQNVLIFPGRRRLLAAAAVLALVVSGIFALKDIQRLRREERRLSQENAELSRRIQQLERGGEEVQAGARPEAPSGGDIAAVRETLRNIPIERTISLLLVAGVARDGTPLPRLVLGQGVTTVRLELGLELEAEGYARYRASLRREGSSAPWRSPILAPSSRSRVVVLVPASALSPGEYTLTLAGERTTGWEEIADYTFRVVRG